MFFILYVLNDINKCKEVVNAWESVGIKGLTILPSTGMGRLKKSVLGDDIPLFPSLQDFFESDETLNRTLFTVTDDESLIDKIVEVTEKVVGDLNKHHTGILVVLPVLRAYGLHRVEN